MINIKDKKILLIRNDNVGDLICTTPAIEALKKRYPNNQIDIVVNSYNFDAIYNNPFIDKIYCYTKPKHKKSFFDKLKAGLGKLKILLDIKKENYEVVIVFRSGYSKSAELFSNITKAKYKIGVKNPKGKDNFTIHIEADHSKNEVEFCFDCLKEFGVNYLDEKTRYFIEEKLTNKYLEYKDYILFHISSRINENRYDKEKFKQVFDELIGYKILVSAEPDDFESAIWLEQNTKAKFIKTKSLQDLGGLIKNVKLFVTLDGGAMHLGPAVGTKTISISGKTNMDKWYPWGYKNLVIQDESKIANNIHKNRIVKVIDEN
ncbi:glycosyl transferase family 9 [Arcobacter nitrofigilis DSM 7299]|uniref:Glycosyl transferase family 9 n=1 Tax=Arcobacter nitrofigilis (strain ATCC 33309 / DSM 7299 / CCUG 15893 / LMG 7604 / NCTC 12251 / CI) TaxID=572480 RepID=D5V0T5_ARCNC|nr:glycosyltransferase family 9 protein [Arcobacter nitrofigilis]ADG93897.1 glycosyl transferase family 9 [Arcobacter nitrofigilis DSM 7299]